MTPNITPSPEESDLLDEQFRALSRQPRRRILTVLQDRQPHAETDLAELLDAPRAADIGASETALLHVHVPHLDDAGYVDWDRHGETISRGSNWDEIEPLLEMLLESQNDRSEAWVH